MIASAKLIWSLIAITTATAVTGGIIYAADPQNNVMVQGLQKIGLIAPSTTTPLITNTPIDADTLASHPGLYYLDAANITGVIDPQHFSAYDSLVKEGKIADGSEIMTDQNLPTSQSTTPSDQLNQTFVKSIEAGLGLVNAGTATKVQLNVVTGAGILIQNDAIVATLGDNVDLLSEVSGVLALANGGTGLTTIPSTGQFLLSNGSGYTGGNLAAGDGLTVSLSGHTFTYELDNTVCRTTGNCAIGGGGGIDGSGNTGQLAIFSDNDTLSSLAGLSWDSGDATLVIDGDIDVSGSYLVNGAPITTSDIIEGSALYYTTSRFDTRFASKSTTDLVEGANLYYTNNRFDLRLATKTTADLAESGNLYFTQGRVSANTDVAANTAARHDAATVNDSATLDLSIAGQQISGSVIQSGLQTSLFNNDAGFVTSLSSFTTTNLTEGTNLYYTLARFNSALATKTTDNLSEGSTNKYFTTGNFNTAWATKTSDDLAQGSTNLYFTPGNFSTALASKTTDDLAQGSTNLYSQWQTVAGGVSFADKVSINSSGNMPYKLTVNGVMGTTSEGDIFAQYDGDSGVSYPVFARYWDANGDFQSGTFLFGNGANAWIGLEKPGGDDVNLFRVHSVSSTFSGSISADGTINGLTIYNTGGTRSLYIDNDLDLVISGASKTITGSGTYLSIYNDMNFGSGTTGTIFLGSSNHSLGLYTTGNTTVFLPTTGTLATLDGTEDLTNKTVNGLAITSSTGTLTVTNGKTLSASNTLTFTGTDGSSVNLGTGGTVCYTGTCAASSVRLDQIAAANTTATIANGSNAIAWNWGTLTTQTGMIFGGGSAQTTGTVFSLEGITFVHTTAENGRVQKIDFTDASTNTSGNTNTHGISIVPTVNTSGAGTKTVNGVYVQPAITGCASGACTINGYNVAVPAATLSNVTTNGITVGILSSSAGTTNGVYITGPAGNGAGTQNAISIGTAAYDNLLIYGSTTILNGSGVLQSAALSGTYSNALTLSSTSNVLAATTFNGLAITNNGTNTLSIAAGKTLTASNSLTFTGTDSTSFALPGSSTTLVGTDSSQTLTNKTITTSGLLTAGAGFTVSSGSVTLSSLTTNGGILYTNGSGVVAQTAAGNSSQCLQSAGGGSPVWGSCGITPGSSWVTQTHAESNSWNSVAFGNNLFVAVASNGTHRVMSSPDGVTWTAQTASEANSWQSVTYGNGKYIAVSSDGTNRVGYSTNGANWFTATASAANSWKTVTYGNNQYVALSTDGTFRGMYSSNGTNWTAMSGTPTNTWQSVTYGNGKFVAVSSDGTNRVIYSTNGTVWSTTTAAEANPWQSVIYNNGRFVAVATSGTHQVMTSPDGITWTAQTAAEANSWKSVTYGGGQFVASSTDGTHRIMTSPDGVTWTAQTAAEANPWSSVTYGSGVFAAISTSGTHQAMTSGSLINTITGSGTTSQLALFDNSSNLISTDGLSYNSTTRELNLVGTGGAFAEAAINGIKLGYWYGGGSNIDRDSFDIGSRFGTEFTTGYWSGITAGYSYGMQYKDPNLSSSCSYSLVGSQKSTFGSCDSTSNYNFDNSKTTDRLELKSSSGITFSATNDVTIAGTSKLIINSGGIKVGSSGTTFTAVYSGTTTWDPASLTNGTSDSTTVTVTGAAMGDVVSVGFSQDIPAGVTISGNVSSSGTVRVTITNTSGGIVDLNSGTLRAQVTHF